MSGGTAGGGVSVPIWPRQTSKSKFDLQVKKKQGEKRRQ